MTSIVYGQYKKCMAEISNDVSESIGNLFCKGCFSQCLDEIMQITRGYGRFTESKNRNIFQILEFFYKKTTNEKYMEYTHILSRRFRLLKTKKLFLFDTPFLIILSGWGHFYKYK